MHDDDPGATRTGAIYAILGYACHRTHHEIKGLHFDFESPSPESDGNRFETDGIVARTTLKPHALFRITDSTGAVYEWRWVRDHWDSICWHDGHKGSFTLLKGRPGFV